MAGCGGLAVPECHCGEPNCSGILSANSEEKDQRRRAKSLPSAANRTTRRTPPIKRKAMGKEEEKATPRKKVKIEVRRKRAKSLAR
jgi:hypothetical protein